MKDSKVIKQKILDEEDFIYWPRLGNSLKQMTKKYPEGIDDERIAKVLLISMKELKEHYKSAVKKLQNKLGV